MIVKITKTIDVRLDGAVKTLTALTRLSLPDNKAQKLIDAGYAEAFVAEIHDARSLPQYCGPGDCCCSEKLPARNYPAGCIKTKCEYSGGV